MSSRHRLPEPAQQYVANITASEFPGTEARRTYVLLALCGITTTLWLIFARFVVPPMIESAYRGESFAFLNSVIEGQTVHPAAFYRHVWDDITLRVLVNCLGFWLLAIVMTSEAFFRRCVGEATPGTLGAIRMWTCAILLVTTLWDDLGTIALLPLEYRADMGLMKILDLLPIGFNGFLTNESSLRAFQRLTEGLLFLGVVGWRTRIIIPLCALCTFTMNGILREYSGFWHQNLVPIYVLTVLSFTPSGDGWSIDRLRRIYRGSPVPDAERTSPLYGWARYACWIPIAVTYASAGFSKLRASGLEWMSATNMRALLYEQTLYPRAGNFSISLHLAPAPDFVFVLLAVVAVAGEALFITVLFSRTCRRILPAAMIVMHVGIIFTQNIVFFDLMLLLLIFYNFAGIRQTISQWARRAGPIEVLYDGTCPFCCRTVRVLRSLDVLRRLEFEEFRRWDVQELNHRHSMRPALATLENELFVRARARDYGGFEAYRVLAFALPPLWPVAPWLFLPGALTLGNAVYGYISRRRLAFTKCDPACSVEDAQGAKSAVSNPGRQRRYGLVCGLTVAAVIAIQGFFWLNRIEYYPFTAVQMFTGKVQTVVTYYKTLGHWESGRVSPVYLEDTLGVFSINSRYEGLFLVCFGDAEQNALCRKTLGILGSAYNRKASGDKLTRLEIQRWKWDFAANPRDPNYGELDARFIGDVAADRRAQAGLGRADRH